MRLARPSTALLILLTATAPTIACLWDYDTLRDEKRGLPGVAEVMAGQWERHSAFFYHHRVDAMRAKLAAHPDDWDAMDNLAVALEKLDGRDAAIAVMLDKERRHPGQYTTAANLGTFYIHKGDLADGIGQLKRALAINPDAHFGREEYQLKLAEYLLRARTAPAMEDADFLHVGLDAALADAVDRRAAATRPLDDVTATLAGFADEESEFVRTQGRVRPFDTLGVKPNVFDGLVGMVRFGTGRSPELYFALGDVLAGRNAKGLAYRAYQRALDFGHPRPDAVRRAMSQVREMVKATGGFDPAVIAAERAAADRWVADYQLFEDGLIRAGKNTDDEASYAPFYATHSRLLQTPDTFWSDFNLGTIQRSPLYGWTVVVVAIVGGLTGLAALRWAGRRVGRLLRHNRPRDSVIVPPAGD